MDPNLLEAIEKKDALVSKPSSRKRRNFSTPHCTLLVAIYGHNEMASEVLRLSPEMFAFGYKNLKTPGFPSRKYRGIYICCCLSLG